LVTGSIEGVAEVAKYRGQPVAAADFLVPGERLLVVVN
jgi:hypothetical protein